MAYDPTFDTLTNKPIGIAVGAPTDGRSYYQDKVNFTRRPYQNQAEVLATLTTADMRTGQFPIFINTGGTLLDGLITGGTNAEWWFKDGVADINLVAKATGGGGGGAASILEAAF